MKITLNQLTAAYARCKFKPMGGDPLTFVQQDVPEDEQLILFHDMDEEGMLESTFVIRDVEPWGFDLAISLAMALAEVLVLEKGSLPDD